MKQSNLPAFKFTPWLKSVVWGGSRIASFKGKAAKDDPIGESWEVSALPGKESVVAEGADRGLTLSELISKYGERLVGKSAMTKDAHDFPLLIKFIDAQNNLSLQVHPDDAMAADLHGATGKTEMWYVIDNEPDAKIYAGFRRHIHPDDYESRVRSGAIMDDVAAHISAPGTTYFLNPGCIHAIGAGNFIIEIQRSSDITYRVYDYNRRDMNGNLRELHLEEARKALDFRCNHGEVVCKPRQISPGISLLVECPYFIVKRVDVDGEFEHDLSAVDSFVTLSCIDGEFDIAVDNCEPMKLKRGETAMIPATAEKVTLRGRGEAVTASVPSSKTNE